MASKKGEKYMCEECGLVIAIEDPCGCETVELVCCSVPMKPVTAKKVKPKANPKAKVKAKLKAKPKAKAKK